MLKCIDLFPAELERCRGASSFLQSALWGRFKARFGWKPLAFRVSWETSSAPRDTALLALYRRLGPALSFAYVPWGPELPLPPEGFPEREPSGAAAGLAVLLRRRLPPGAACIRFDFPWYTEDPAGENAAGTETLFPRRPFVPAAANVQAPDTVLVNLLSEETGILGAMKPKWRYNVSLAEKKGVAVTAVFSSAAGGGDDTLRNGLERFYRLYRETAIRDGIAIHGMDYYTALFEEAAGNGAEDGVDVRLYLASCEGEDLAGIITLFRGREAVYLYGASSSRMRNLMAPYALQWRAMRDARTAGCAYYDLFGIPPRPPEEDPNHPMAGLYRFKTGFIGDQAAGKRPGGTIIHRPGSWDYPCRPAAWALYTAAEKARKKIRDLKKRRR